MSGFLSAFFRLTVRFMLVFYVLLAVVLLGVRYWVLPNIDRWRDDIAEQLSVALQLPVEVGSVQAEWTSLYPRFSLQSVSIADPQGRPIFRLPQLQAELSWRTLLGLTPQFRQLTAEGLELHIRRDLQGRVWLLGQVIDTEGAAADIDLDTPALRWLASQRSVALTRAVVHWTDDYRHLQPMVLRNVAWRLRNQGGSHEFSVEAALPPQLGQRLTLRGAFVRQGSGQPFSVEQLDGRLYTSLEGVVPEGWGQRFSVSASLPQGRWTVQTWLDVKAGRPGQFDAQMQAAGGAWRPNEQTQAGFDELSARVRLPWARLAHLLGGAVSDEELSASAGPAYELQVAGLKLQADTLFAEPLAFDDVRLRGTASGGGGQPWSLRLEQAAVNNADFELALAGSWRDKPGTEAGVIDLKGRFQRAELAAIVRYLPLTVNVHARDWMRAGLLKGRLLDAPVAVSGDLTAFPYGERPEAGDFLVHGRMADAVIDYVPAQGKTPGWPRLESLQGDFSLRRVDLRLSAHQARMPVAPGRVIDWHGLKARIPDIENDPRLSVFGESQGEASAYLALMPHSPLGALLDGALDEASATGRWRLPLALDVPLMHSIDTKVQGTLHFAGGQWQLMPEMPPFENVQGQLAFTETGISAQDLSARFLGGPVSISGGLGGGAALTLQGRATDAALVAYAGVEGMRRLRGRVAYQARLQREKQGGLGLTVTSDLVGMALDFPAPLEKAAERAMPLTARWQPQGRGLVQLAVELGSDKALQLRLLRKEGEKRGPYFHAGGLAWRGDPAPLPEGMRVSMARLPLLDGDAWEEVTEEFGQPLRQRGKGAGNARSRPLLPELLELQVQADRLLYGGQFLDAAAVTMREDAQGRVQLDMNSRQTVGRLRWQENPEGKIVGEIDADFERLSLGRGADERRPRDADDVVLRADEVLDVPGMRLKARHFVLYGRDLGALSLVGRNRAHGELWQLERLTLGTPDATIAGSGAWRLSGPEQGLTLDVQGEIADLGAYLARLGFPTMQSGKGSMQGHFTWRGEGLDFRLNQVRGKADFQLEKGRLITLNSRSARLLELLSLQSMQRLSRMDMNLASLNKDGFPYDTMGGTFILDEGLVRTANYRVTGPAGTLVLGGEIDLDAEELDLEAVVVPNLDVSGAAIAAGIAINPVVGIGAFLTQWLLKAPLAKAMTAEYRVRGSWDAPKIEDAALSATSSPG